MRKGIAMLLPALAISAVMVSAKEAEHVARLNEAAKVFSEIQGAKDRGIPDKLLDKANGVIIVPGLKRAGFVIGGEFGKGVFLVRTASGWSAPSTIRVEGGSIGLQIGAGETDLIMLAMDKGAVEQLMKTGVKIGGDVMAAAGPVGRASEAATTPIPEGGLLSYSRAKGAFAGIELKGTTLRSDDKDNAKLYGREITQEEILSGKVAAPPAAAKLMSTLRRYFRSNPQSEAAPARKR